MGCDSLSYYFLFLIFIIGLCLGSFYNVIIIRSLNNESIVFPPSKCPKCNNKLKIWHNVPVLSYIFLRGKCAFCREKISIQYPIVELITGILFALVFIKFGLTLTTIFILFCISCFIIMTGTDLKEKIVDCNLAIAIVVLGILYSLYNFGIIGLIHSVTGAIVGFIIIEAIAKIGNILKKDRAMGEADSYVAGAIGAVAGISQIGWVLLYSLVASMIFILPVFWYAKYKANDAKILLFSSVFIMSIAFTIIFQHAYWSLFLLILTGLMLAILLIKDIKNSVEMNCVPFVPALCVGFLYYVIFVLV